MTRNRRQARRTKPGSVTNARQDALNDTRIVQLFWSTILVATIGTPAAMSEGWIGILAAALLLINFIACIACFWNFRAAWALALLFVVVVLSQQLYVNLMMVGRLFRGVEPNALGTIMLVAVNTTLLIAPATLISFAYFINRQRLAAIMLPKQTASEGNTAGDLDLASQDSNNPYSPPCPVDPR